MYQYFVKDICFQSCIITGSNGVYIEQVAKDF